MGDVLDTIFMPLTDRALPVSGPAAFLNARYHAALEVLKPRGLMLQQSFKPHAQTLQDRGFQITSEITKPVADRDAVFMEIPKNMKEARFMTAQAYSMLRDRGFLIMAGANDAGGGRIKGIFEDFGFTAIQELSKNKARVVWATKTENSVLAVQVALAEGSLQKVETTGFYSMPGIFGWDKIDEGSKILLQHLPETMNGHGADFGCGYGYLSQALLQRGVSALNCVDADFRAIKVCRLNMEHMKPEARLTYFWEDLSRPVSGLKSLDWIVMNPPFHEGKSIDISLGNDFIRTAYESLRSGGVLWMVANVHLSYEALLDDLYTQPRKIFEGKGFKVFSARK